MTKAQMIILGFILATVVVVSLMFFTEKRKKANSVKVAQEFFDPGTGVVIAHPDLMDLASPIRASGRTHGMVAEYSLTDLNTIRQNNSSGRYSKAGIVNLYVECEVPFFLKIAKPPGITRPHKTDIEGIDRNFETYSYPEEDGKNWLRRAEVRSLLEALSNDQRFEGLKISPDPTKTIISPIERKGIEFEFRSVDQTDWGGQLESMKAYALSMASLFECAKVP
jgi:hypothetical protein